MNDNIVLFRSLDACLGPGDSRFFGSGYTRVGQELRQLCVNRSAAPGSLITGRASLRYPDDWSRKAAGRELRPHLSSIDALVFAVSLAEVHVNVARDLTSSQQRRTWVRSVRIRAGSGPHEELDDFPVRAQLRVTVGAGPELFADAVNGLLTSEYHCQIGTLVVRCRLAHAAGTPSFGAASADFDRLDDVLGPAPMRHYGSRYKTHRLHADDVGVDLAAGLVRARQHVTVDAVNETDGHGAEAAYAPSVSLVDALVGTAQLAQTLLYAQDRMVRTHSNTLWMRRLSIDAITPVRPVGEPFPVEVRVAKNQLLYQGGSEWRAVDLTVSDFAGINGACSLAHRLPEATTA